MKFTLTSALMKIWFGGRGYTLLTQICSFYGEYLPISGCLKASKSGQDGYRSLQFFGLELRIITSFLIVVLVVVCWRYLPTIALATVG